MLAKRESIFACSILLLLLAVQAPATAAGTQKQPTGAPSTLPPSTTDKAMKWKPLPDPWVDCRVRDMICRCSGDVVDCRNPRPVEKKKD